LLFSSFALLPFFTSQYKHKIILSYSNWLNLLLRAKNTQRARNIREVGDGQRNYKKEAA
jgi:hypothetical protein